MTVILVDQPEISHEHLPHITDADAVGLRSAMPGALSDLSGTTQTDSPKPFL